MPTLITPNVGELLLINRPLHITKALYEESQREPIFNWRCAIRGKVCGIIGGGNGTNVTSKKLIDKLQIPTKRHPTPHSLQWVVPIKEVTVSKQVIIFIFYLFILWWSTLWCSTNRCMWMHVIHLLIDLGCFITMWIIIDMWTHIHSSTMGVNLHWPFYLHPSLTTSSREREGWKTIIRMKHGMSVSIVRASLKFP